MNNINSLSTKLTTLPNVLTLPTVVTYKQMEWYIEPRTELYLQNNHTIPNSENELETSNLSDVSIIDDENI